MINILFKSYLTLLIISLSSVQASVVTVAPHTNSYRHAQESHLADWTLLGSYDNFHDAIYVNYEAVA